MKARQCQRCGAPLPEAAAHESVTCEFCGMAYDPTTTFRPAVSVKMAPGTGTGKRVLLIVLAVVLVPILGAFALTCVALVSAKRAVDRVGATRRGPVQPRPPAAWAPRRAVPVKPADLAAGGGWQALDCVPPTGGYGTFDAVASLPWAVSLAQAWRSDARLERVDVDRLRPDGTLNLQDDQAATSRYRFLSPSLLQEQRRQADLGKPDVKAGLFIEIKMGEVRALVTSASSHREFPPPHPASLPLKAILAAVDRAGKLPPKPFYSGYLIHLEREGWVWYLHTLSRQESIPRVRAADGKTYPFR